MRALSRLRAPVDAFFDKVTVNARGSGPAREPAEAPQRPPAGDPGGGGFLPDRGLARGRPTLPPGQETIGVRPVAQAIQCACESLVGPGTASFAERADDQSPPPPRRSPGRPLRRLPDEPAARRPDRRAGRGDDLSAWYVGSIDDEPFDVPLVDRSPHEARTSAPDRVLCGPRAARHDRGRYRRPLPLPRRARRPSDPLRDRRRPPGLLLARRRECRPQGRVAGVVADDRPWSASSRSSRATARPASTTRSAPARSTSTRTARDTLFRIHGTNEPWSIGEQVSSGCVRMLNEDVLDLYNRVPVGTTVLVRRNGRWRV